MASFIITMFYSYCFIISISFLKCCPTTTTSIPNDNITDNGDGELVIDYFTQKVMEHPLLHYPFEFKVIKAVEDQLGFNVNARYGSDSTSPLKLKSANSKLFKGIKCDDKEVVLKGVASGSNFIFDINSQGKYLIPLEFALRNDKFEAFKALFGLFHIIINAGQIDSQRIALNQFITSLLLCAIELNQLKFVSFMIAEVEYYIQPDYMRFVELSIRSRTSGELLKFLLDKTNLSSSKANDPRFSLLLKLSVDSNNCPAFLLLKSNLFEKLLFSDSKTVSALIESAVKEKKTSFILKLLELDESMMRSFQNELGNSLLHLAVIHSDFDLLYFLIIKYNFVIDLSNNLLQSSLHLAYSLQNMDAFKFFIRHLDSDYTNHLVSQMLHILRFCPDLNTFETVMTQSTEILSKTFIETFTEQLISCSQFKFVNILMKIYKNSLTLSPKVELNLSLDQFILQIFKGDLIHLFEHVLKHKNISNNMSVFGTNLLNYAVINGKLEFIKLILFYSSSYSKGDSEADILNSQKRIVNSADGFGNAPIDLAISSNHGQVIRFLIPFLTAPIEIKSYESFLLVLLNGGSFFRSISATSSRTQVLSYFIEYYKTLLKSTSILPREIILISLHLEIFLFFNFFKRFLSSDLLEKIKTISNLKVKLGKFIKSDESNTELMIFVIKITNIIASSFSINVYERLILTEDSASSSTPFLSSSSCSYNRIQPEDIFQILPESDIVLIEEFKFILINKV